MLNKITYILIFVLFIFIGCGDSASDDRPFTKHPGYEYMPDMYRSPSYETYSENAFFSNNSTARQPVEGTIPRDFMPFEYENSLDDYLRAGEELTNPLEVNSANLESGEELYVMFCAHCHGKNGDGNGSIQHPAYLAAPSYFDTAPRQRAEVGMIDLSDGHMYHAITYGVYQKTKDSLGVDIHGSITPMGPHASMINAEERWKIIMYVNELQKENN